MSVEPNDQVIVEKNKGIGYITLNRPSALNTINLPMVKVIHSALKDWAQSEEIKAVVIKGNGDKAFCAGGDVRRVYECIKEGSGEYEDFFQQEFELDKYIYNYPKPCIALMHGIVMGGGMGLTQGAKFRVVCETTKIAMPETAIGYFPDVGASYFLTRKNPALAVYLGVTGKLLSAQDTLYCNLADWILPMKQWDAFKVRLEEIKGTSATNSVSDQILGILKDLGGSTQHQDSTVWSHIDSINAVFALPSLLEIYDALYARGTESWAVETLEGMKKNSPLAMAASQQLLNQGSKLSLNEAFAVELELNFLWKTRGEFVEGVRAALVDKDKKPVWKYSLSDVNTALLKDNFPPLFKHYKP